MARLIGVDLPREKRMAIALTYIYGVGRSQATKALEATGIDPQMKSKDLTDDQTLALRDWIELHLKVEVTCAERCSRHRRRPSSLELTPFIVAHAEIGEKTVPAWLEVVPSKMRILVHAIPARAAIDTMVNEQLIVELYSK